MSSTLSRDREVYIERETERQREREREREGESGIRRKGDIWR